MKQEERQMNEHVDRQTGESRAMRAEKEVGVVKDI